MLIGLTGAAGCGKSTVSKHLREKHDFFDFSLAEPIYGMVSAMTGLTVDALKIRDTKEQEIPWLGLSPRELLQRIGTEFGRCVLGDDVWIKHLMRRIEATSSALERMTRGFARPHFAIADVRFDNEAEAIKAKGGEIWMISRDAKPCLSQAASSHSSEAGVSRRNIDRVIENNGTLEALKRAVDESLHLATGAYN